MIAFAHPDDTWRGFNGTMTTAGTVTTSYPYGYQYTGTAPIAVRYVWSPLPQVFSVAEAERVLRPQRKNRRTELAHLLAAPSPPRKAPRTREHRPAMSRPHQRGQGPR